MIAEVKLWKRGNVSKFIVYMWCMGGGKFYVYFFYADPKCYCGGGSASNIAFSFSLIAICSSNACSNSLSVNSSPSSFKLLALARLPFGLPIGGNTANFFPKETDEGEDEVDCCNPGRFDIALTKLPFLFSLCVSM